MKKILLLLSCFLATWCSVQAASGSITSATYNASNSTFNVSYTSSGANSVYMDVICMRTGPVSRVTLNSGSASKTINLPITSRDGEYDLVLYVNGTPCYDKKVTVSKYGHLDKVTASSAGVVTINYTMLHAETDNYPSKSYLKIGNARHNITNVKNGSYAWGLNLKPGTYTCGIYVDDKCLNTCEFEVPKPKVIVIPDPTGEINDVAYTAYNNTFVVDYTLKDASNPTISIYDDYTGQKIYNANITNSSTSKRIEIKNLSVENNKKYRFVISAKKSDGKIWSTEKYITLQIVAPDNDEITNVEYLRSSDRLKVDFRVKNSGQNVRVRVLTSSGRTAISNIWNSAPTTGTLYVDAPSGYGSVIYVVLLEANNRTVASKQIVISK